MICTDVVEGWALAGCPAYVGPPDAQVGVRGTDGTSVGFNDAHLGRHVLFVGGIGTGKTVGMQALVDSVRHTMTPEDVMIVFDTKGDFYETFYRDGDAVITVAGEGVFRGTQAWNLFAELRTCPDEDLVDEVNEIAATLFEGIGKDAGDNNRFWTTMAQELFAAIVLCLARIEREDPTGKRRYSNRDLRGVADKWDLATIRDLVGRYPDLKGTLQYIARDDSNTTNSVLIFLQQMLRQTFSSKFNSTGTFSVREFVRGKQARALFLEFDVARGATLTPVFRTLVDVALKESLGRNRAQGRVFVILDEFALLPNLRHIDAGLNFGRSLGMRFIVGTQNVGQITDSYGPGLGASILSAFGTVFSFRLFDAASREYIRGRFGTNRQLLRYETVVKSRGMGEQLLEGHVVEDWNLTGLRVGQCVAALPDSAPYLFTFAPPT